MTSPSKVSSENLLVRLPAGEGYRPRGNVDPLRRKIADIHFLGGPDREREAEHASSRRKGETARNAALHPQNA